jgi:hypothetical protein
MHEPPDDCAPGEAPQAQNDGGSYPGPRALLVSRHGRVSVFCEQGQRNPPDSQPNTQRHEDHVVQVAENGNTGISANRLYGCEWFLLQTVQTGSWPANVALFDLVSLRVRLLSIPVRYLSTST